MAFDLKLIETNNGGDFVNLGNDLAVTNGIITMIYLALFGGNNWWANDLLMKSQPSQMFNSITETTLNNTALNSEGRTVIENAVKTDLKYLSDLFNITVNVTLPKLDTVQINLTIIELDKSQKTNLIITLQKTKTGDFSILDFSVSDFLI